MTTLAERLKNPAMRRAIKQRRLVLDITTSIEDELNRRGMSMTAFAKALGKSKALVSRIFRQQPNLTLFTAVELADALDMDIQVEVVPRHEYSNVIYLQGLIANSSPAPSVEASAMSIQIVESSMRA